MIKVYHKSPLYFFSTDIHFGLLTLAKIGEKKKYFPQLHRKASTTILGLWLKYSQADKSQFRSLKTIHFHWMLHRWCAYFGRSGAWPRSLIWAWRAAPVRIPPHTVSLCELDSSLPTTSSTHFLPGSGGRGCAHSRSASWEDEGEVFTWSRSPVPSSLTSHKVAGPVGWNSISPNNRIIQYKSLPHTG